MTDQETLPEPTITVEDAGPAKKRISVDVPPERIAAKINESYGDLQAEATLPGFRRGHAPRRLLERRFGGDIRSEVRNQLLGEAYQEAVESNELRPLGEPDIKDHDKIELPDDGPLHFDIEIEVVPEIELPDLSELEVDKPAFETSDEDINAELERFAETYGQAKPVEQSQPNDFATANIRILDSEGDVLEEQTAQQVFIPGEQRKFKGVVAGILIEDLGRKLEGKRAGETVTLDATGPGGHENEQLREKPLTIELTLNSIQRHMPLSTEELVETAGMESEEELRERVRTQLEARNVSEQQRAMASQATDYLLEKVDVELPENMSARQSEQILRRRATEMMYRGADQREIEENLAELRASSEKEAQREIKLLFVLDAVARKLDVEVDDAEVNGRVAQMAMQQGRRPEQYRAELVESGQIEQLYVQLREEKAIQKMLEDAKVNEVSAEDWRKRQEEEEKKEEKEKEAGTESGSGSE